MPEKMSYTKSYWVEGIYFVALFLKVAVGDSVTRSFYIEAESLLIENGKLVCSDRIQ